MNEKFEAVSNSSATDKTEVWSTVARQAYDSSSNQIKPEQVACYGHFSSAPTNEAFRLNPPQIGINGGFALFNQGCDDERIKALKNFKPYGIWDSQNTTLYYEETLSQPGQN